jgi:hypothetical protein
MEQEAIRDFVADSTPDMQEAIDAARAEYGDEQFDEMVAEVVRRANDPMRYTADLEELAEDEAFEELDDDVTLDVLGSGDDIEGGGELTDMLSAWRDDVDSVPPSPGTAPETVQQIHDFAQEIDRATNPPRSTEGSTSPMSALSELAAQVAQHADMQEIITTLGQVETLLQGKKQTLMELLAETSHSDAAVNSIATVQAILADQGLPAINQASEAIMGIARAIRGGVG